METEIIVKEIEKIITAERNSRGNVVEVKSRSGNKGENSCFR